MKKTKRVQAFVNTLNEIVLMQENGTLLRVKPRKLRPDVKILDWEPRMQKCEFCYGKGETCCDMWPHVISNWGMVYSSADIPLWPDTHVEFYYCPWCGKKLPRSPIKNGRINPCSNPTRSRNTVRSSGDGREAKRRRTLHLI